MDDRQDLAEYDDPERAEVAVRVDDGLDEVDGLDDADDDEDFERRVARRRPGGAVEELLRDVYEVVDQARPAALSSTAVKVDRDELLDLLDQALERLPEELRSARWLLKEREEFLARTNREADEILAAARGQSERMVQRSEVIRSAEAKARRIVEQSRADAARIRSECDDYCDQRLAQLEAILERTMTVVGAGREKLRPSLPERGPSESRSSDEDGLEDGADEGTHKLELKMFDQDRV